MGGGSFGDGAGRGGFGGGSFGGGFGGMGGGSSHGGGGGRGRSQTIWNALRSCSAHIQRKNYLKFWGSEKPAGFSEPLFHGEKLPQSKPDGFASFLWEGASCAPGHLLIVPNTLAMGLTACALSVTCGDTSPKGRGKSTAANFLIMPNTLATSLRPWLPLWGSWRGSA